MGCTTAVPTPPPTHTAWPDSMSSVGLPSGPATSVMASPTSSAHRSMVVLPTAWMTSVMVPALRVRVGDGQRDALGPGPEADDDELARLADQRDPRRRDDEPGDVG